MIHYSDEAIVEGLRLRSDYIINFAYKEFYPLIRFLVTDNGGEDQDAEDVFQDGIVTLYNKIIQNQLELTSSFKTYMYSVCRGLWFQKLKMRDEVYTKLKDVETYIELPAAMFDSANVKETELQRIVQIHYLSIPADCQKLIRLFLKKTPLKEITGIMGFKTEKYSKTRKFLCKEDLKKRVADDPRVTKYFNYEKPNKTLGHH